jgi:rSAM/selenodomain-associated transferase 1
VYDLDWNIRRGYNVVLLSLEGDIGMDDDERLLIFAKFPEKGMVKTRLGRVTGEETAVELYRCFVRDAISLSRKAGYAPSIFFHPPEAREAMTEWLGRGLAYEPQEGDSLGERMYAAFRRVFRNCRRAVLIGADTPDLPPALVEEAFHSLKTRDAVIGPARDGGYYLIGLSSDSLLPDLFQGLPWGSALIFDLTRRIFEEHGLTLHLLPRWGDIDEYDDLAAFFDRWKGLPQGVLATIDHLRDHGW